MNTDKPTFKEHCITTQVMFPHTVFKVNIMYTGLCLGECVCMGVCVHVHNHARTCVGVCMLIR